MIRTALVILHYFDNLQFVGTVIVVYINNKHVKFTLTEMNANY